MNADKYYTHRLYSDEKSVLMSINSIAHIYKLLEHTAKHDMELLLTNTLWKLIEPYETANIIYLV